MSENPTQILEKSLQSLAVCLETPVIPGEMVEWAGSVRKALDAAEPILRRNIDTVHKTEYEQILHEDRGLSHRVEALRKGDADSLTRLDGLKKCLDNLTAKAQRKGPDEQAVDDDVGGFTDQGLQFVIHAQKQEVGRKTWLQPARTS